MDNICVFEGIDPHHLMFKIFIFKFMDKIKIFPKMIITGLFETHVLPLWIFHHFYLAVPHSFIRSEFKKI